MDTQSRYLKPQAVEKELSDIRSIPPYILSFAGTRFCSILHSLVKSAWAHAHLMVEHPNRDLYWKTCNKEEMLYTYKNRYLS